MTDEERRQRKEGVGEKPQAGSPEHEGKQKLESWSENQRRKDRYEQYLSEVCWIFKTHSYLWHFFKRQKHLNCSQLYFSAGLNQCQD